MRDCHGDPRHVDSHRQVRRGANAPRSAAGSRTRSELAEGLSTNDGTRLPRPPVRRANCLVAARTNPRAVARDRHPNEPWPHSAIGICFVPSKPRTRERPAQSNPASSPIRRRATWTRAAVGTSLVCACYQPPTNGRSGHPIDATWSPTRGSTPVSAPTGRSRGETTRRRGPAVTSAGGAKALGASPAR